MECSLLSFVLAILYFSSFLVGDVHSFAITGIRDGVQPSGQRPFRTEINDFASAGPAFDLFFLSTQAIQQMNETELLSFFQVAGKYCVPCLDLATTDNDKVFMATRPLSGMVLMEMHPGDGAIVLMTLSYFQSGIDLMLLCMR